MTRSELVVLACGLYDEYRPKGYEDIDEDLKTLIENFLEINVTEFEQIIQAESIPQLVYNLINPPVIPIEYKGGFIGFNAFPTFTPKFLKLVSFKHNEWSKTLTNDDLINISDPRRKLQETYYTAGGTSKPVICLEYKETPLSNKSLGLAFWGYKNDLYAGASLKYVIKVATLDNMLILLTGTENTFLLKAYCLYTLSKMCITTKDIDLANVFIKEFTELLIIHNIQPTQPVRFNQTNK